MSTFLIGSGPVSLGKQPSRNLDFFVSEIGARWHKMTEGILEVAALCVDAIQTLGPTDRSALRKRLGFAKGTMSKLVRIGHDERLRTELVRSHLPPSYTTLYEIAGLTDAQLAAGLADGVIRIDMHREDLAAWLNKTKEAQPEILFTLVGLEEITEGRMAMFQDRLRKALLEFPEIEARSKDKEWTFRSFRSVPTAEAA